MGIQVTFMAQPCMDTPRFPFHREKPSLDTFLEALEIIIQDFKCRGEICADTRSVKVHFCPQGYLLLRFQGASVRGDCLTSQAGAGFHAGLADFLDRLFRKAGYEAQVEDPTGYYADRDFEQLRGRHMLPWMMDVLEAVLSSRSQDMAFAVGWDAGGYYPEVTEPFVLTPVGAFRREELKELAQGRDDKRLAECFFIWDNRKKDALFYRNAALSLLWHHCAFAPSSRSQEDQEGNEAILRLLKKAAKMDGLLPFPKKEYLELCELAGERPMGISRLTDYESPCPIGYRRGNVIERVGAFDVHLPGRLIRDYDGENNALLFLDKKEDGREITLELQSYSLPEHADLGCIYKGVEEEIRFYGPHTSVRAAIKADPESGKCSVMGQVLCGRKILLASFQGLLPEEKEWAVEILSFVIPNGQ